MHQFRRYDDLNVSRKELGTSHSIGFITRLMFTLYRTNFVSEDVAVDL